MDAGLVFMIVAVVTIGCVTGVVSDWLKTQKDIAKSKADGTAAGSDHVKRLEEQVAKLEERVKVLERIQTDPTERLKRELETL